MRHVLAPRASAVIDAFVALRPLIAFDFDGTLAPIARTPEDVAMRPATRRLLAGLARLVPCVVISGRRRSDVLRYVGDAGLAAVVGNHGLEPSGRVRPDGRLALWAAELRARLARHGGIWVEDKGFSLAVHYRASRDWARSGRVSLRAARALRGARAFGGKAVVNVVPVGATDKAGAVLRLRDQLRCGAVVYVGDEETDESVFALADRDLVLGIRVGHDAGSAARYYVRRQSEVDALVGRILRAARRQGRRPRGAVRIGRSAAARGAAHTRRPRR